MGTTKKTLQVFAVLAFVIWGCYAGVVEDLESQIIAGGPATEKKNVTAYPTLPMYNATNNNMTTNMNTTGFNVNGTLINGNLTGNGTV